jgi:hypothetical protein
MNRFMGHLAGNGWPHFIFGPAFAKGFSHSLGPMYRGLQRVDQQFKLTMTASNIVRMARMLCMGPQGTAQ